jgi:hypothetical protein
MNDRVLVAVIMIVLVIAAIMWISSITSDDIRNLEGTQTERAWIATWEAEINATLSADATAARE